MSDWIEFSQYLQKLEKKRNVKTLFLVESGSRLYGFADDGSDIDLRGVLLDDVHNILSLNSSLNTTNGDFGEVDYEMHELRKFMSMLHDGNFNLIEWVFSPFVEKDITHLHSQQIDRLQNIALRCISPSTGKHVRGWAYSIYNMDWSKPKKSLYAVRPMMVYIHFCKNQEIESNITKLTKFDEFAHMKEHINELIQLKKTNSNVPQALIEKNKDYYDELKEKTKTVENELTQPDKEVEEKINDFIIEMYEEYGGDDFEIKRKD